MGRGGGGELRKGCVWKIVWVERERNKAMVGKRNLRQF